MQNATALRPVPSSRVTIADNVWAPRIRVNREETLPVEYRICKDTGRIDCFKLDWKPGQPAPHIFWDSDVAKWIEAACYSLVTNPDPALLKRVDETVDLVVSAQQPDGYLNVHFTVVEPEKRFANLQEWHEMYCMGHLMEAAVAHFNATGSRKFLDAMCRCADLLGRVFGPGEGQKHGYCGHPEIELALVKLARASGNPRYLELAKFFVDQRGTQPHYYEQERRELERRGISLWGWYRAGYDGCQAHRPIREMKDAEGHAVRAMYLFAGVADVAAATGDVDLLAAARRVFDSVAERRMYITGGIGSSPHGERFSYDYDLPNESSYAETCAAIALVFFAHRMVQIDADSKYTDAMERALYNGVISGVGLDGKTFLYANPLSVYPRTGVSATNFPPARQEWFDCACCPPNVARLLASLGDYVYSETAGRLYVHLYARGGMKTTLGDVDVAIGQDTRYPWDGKVMLKVDPSSPAKFALLLRIPGWARKHILKINGKTVAAKVVKGYARLDRTWLPGDRVELSLDMPIEIIQASPLVRQGCGRFALQRGPVVYCLEQADNGADLADMVLNRKGMTTKYESGLLGGVMTIVGKALRRDPAAWKRGLYRPVDGKVRKCKVKAIPYATWGNRKPGEMLVWAQVDA
jgi:DUF1680 family protein